MTTLYHLIEPSAWQQLPAGPYVAPSLATEGFIHCCYRHQLETIANLFYAVAADLLVLYLDADQLGERVRAEPADVPFANEMFPHVYAPIDRAAILQVRALIRDVDGRWRLPAAE